MLEKVWQEHIITLLEVSKNTGVEIVVNRDNPYKEAVCGSLLTVGWEEGENGEILETHIYASYN